MSASTTDKSSTTATMPWDARVDVIYHFYAYHFFEKPRHARSIDMINLTDADVQHYQRVADLARGLGEHYKLAEYLKSQGPYTLSTSFADGATISENIHGQVKLSFRQRLIHHVHVYNLTQEPRRRFYLLGLADEDVNFPRFFAERYEESVVDGTGRQVSGRGGNRALAMATDVCEALPQDISYNGTEVELAVEKYLANHEGAKTAAFGETGETKF